MINTASKRQIEEASIPEAMRAGLKELVEQVDNLLSQIPLVDRYPLKINMAHLAQKAVARPSHALTPGLKLAARPSFTDAIAGRDRFTLTLTPPLLPGKGFTYRRGSNIALKRTSSVAIRLIVASVCAFIRSPPNRFAIFKSVLVTDPSNHLGLCPSARERSCNTRS